MKFTRGQNSTGEPEALEDDLENAPRFTAAKN